MRGIQYETKTECERNIGQNLHSSSSQGHVSEYSRSESTKASEEEEKTYQAEEAQIEKIKRNVSVHQKSQSTTTRRERPELCQTLQPERQHETRAWMHLMVREYEKNETL